MYQSGGKQMTASHVKLSGIHAEIPRP